MLYRILLGTWSFRFPENQQLTDYLTYLLQYDLVSICEEEGLVQLTFRNGVTVVAWNKERYAGWFSMGRIYNNRGTLMTWSQSRPSTKLLWKLSQLISIQ